MAKKSGYKFKKKRNVQIKKNPHTYLILIRKHATNDKIKTMLSIKYIHLCILNLTTQRQSTETETLTLSSATINFEEQFDRAKHILFHAPGDIQTNKPRKRQDVTLF